MSLENRAKFIPLDVPQIFSTAEIKHGMIIRTVPPNQDPRKSGVNDIEYYWAAVNIEGLAPYTTINAVPVFYNIGQSPLSNQGFDRRGLEDATQGHSKWVLGKIKPFGVSYMSIREGANTFFFVTESRLIITKKALIDYINSMEPRRA